MILQDNISKRMRLKNCFAAAVLASAMATNAQPAKITVDAAHSAHVISPMLWGIFFEDINLSADGGIYPELVRNRSFEDSDHPDFWKLSNGAVGNGMISVESSHPLNTFNLHNLRVERERRIHIGKRRLLGHEHRQGRRLHFEVCRPCGWICRRVDCTVGEDERG